jgi:hypothetical protein
MKSILIPAAPSAAVFGVPKVQSQRKLMLLVASLVWSALALFAANLVHAEDTPALKTKDVILVHGAWADGSSWSKVIALLERRGFHVTAVQLPLTSVADDVATVTRAIELDPGPLHVGYGVRSRQQATVQDRATYWYCSYLWCCSLRTTMAADIGTGSVTDVALRRLASLPTATLSLR